MPDRSAGVQQGREQEGVEALAEARGVELPWSVVEWLDHELMFSSSSAAWLIHKAVQAHRGETGEPPASQSPEGYDKHLEAESGDDKSDITRVLRLTASRLRDPEYRWSVDPAVTLERLAERLEGTEPLTDEEIRALVEHRDEHDPAARTARAKLRARLAREDGG